MPQQLTAEIAECYLRAAQCRMRAQCTPHPNQRQDYHDMEQRWLTMARNYEFAKRLFDFTSEVKRRDLSRRA